MQAIEETLSLGPMDHDLMGRSVATLAVTGMSLLDELLIYVHANRYICIKYLTLYAYLHPSMRPCIHPLMHPCMQADDQNLG